MNILIVDDSRERQEAFRKKLAWTKEQLFFASDYNQAIKVLQTIPVDILFLDHDLGQGKTGYDLAYWMEEQEYNGNINLPSTIYIHSMNPFGARNIQAVFPQAILCPGAWLKPFDNEGTGE